MTSSRRHLRTMSSEEAFDPYQLEDPTHNPNAFYPYCGKESSSVTTRVPSDYMERIAALVARREIPEYQTPADFIRDAIHHRLYWYQNQYQHPEIGDQMNVFVMREQSKERRAAMKARIDVITDLRGEFYEAQAARLPAAQKIVLEQVELALTTRDADDDTFRSALEGLRAEFKAGIRQS